MALKSLSTLTNPMLLSEIISGGISDPDAWTMARAVNVGSFVIPNWYFVVTALAVLAYYGAFRKHDILR